MNAENLDETILNALSLVAGGTGAGTSASDALASAMGGLGEGSAGSIQQLTAQLGQLQEVGKSQAEVLVQNTQAVLQSNSVQASASGSSVAGTLGQVVTTVLGSSLSLVPLIGGLLSLFSGGGSDAPVKPTKYEAPSSLTFPLGFSESTGGEIGTLDYGLNGMPRLVETPAGPEGNGGTDSSTPSVLSYLRESASVQTSYESSGDGTSGSGVGGTSSTRNYAPQITVQVQAMDSRSFLDHSDEIAAAVRTALLSSNSLNDVIAEL